MNIGIGQILVILLIILLLFGNLPSLLKDLGRGSAQALKEMKKLWNEDENIPKKKEN